jgi:hypothetical protein
MLHLLLFTVQLPVVTLQVAPDLVQSLVLVQYVPLLEEPLEHTPHVESAVQVVARSPHSLTEQLATLVQVCPPKAHRPLLFNGQSVSTEQACAVVWFEAFRHSP